MKKCIVCGKEFEGERGWQRICNSEDCHITRRKQSQKEYRDKKVIHYNKVCKICGKDFTSSSPQVIICSKECKKILRRNIVKRSMEKHKEEYLRKAREKRWKIKNESTYNPNKICIICGKEFISYDSRVVACSDACRYERKKRYNRGYGLKQRKKENLIAK